MFHVEIYVCTSFLKDCTKFGSCRNKGFHAHHPRDCLFYLRDDKYTIEGFQQLLRDNNVEFDTNPPQGQLEAAAQEGVVIEGKKLLFILQ